MEDVVLEHLVLYPRGGVCNRLRAIASAKRLGQLTGARCTIVWDWGDYRALLDDDTDWLPYAPPMNWRENLIVPGYHHVRHLLQHEGGSRENHRVPVTTHPKIAVISLYVFCAAEEPLLPADPNAEAGVLPWFPRPHPDVLARVEAFRQAHMPHATAGIHIRRTDNIQATARSPDRAYVAEADRLAESGYALFLATDNEATLRTMQRRYGAALIHYPKRSALERRWPKKGFELDESIEDMVDLWLLASCDLVIGSAASSYSRVAIALNGSEECKTLDRSIPRWRRSRWWMRQRRDMLRNRYRRMLHR